MSEAGGHIPVRIPTEPSETPLVNGHLYDPDPGPPACPRCLFDAFAIATYYLHHRRIVDAPEKARSHDDP